MQQINVRLWLNQNSSVISYAAVLKFDTLITAASDTDMMCVLRLRKGVTVSFVSDGRRIPRTAKDLSVTSFLMPKTQQMGESKNKPLTFDQKNDLIRKLGKACNIDILPNGRKNTDDSYRIVYTTLTHITIQIFIGILLCICLLKMPYGYYQFVRICAGVGFGYLAYCEYGMRRFYLVIPYIITSILFNPIVPIHLNRETWNVIDIAIGCSLLLWSALDFLLGTKRKNRAEYFFDYFSELLEKTSRQYAPYPLYYFVRKVRTNKSLSKSEKDFLIAYLDSRLSKLTSEERIIDSYNSWNIYM